MLPRMSPFSRRQLLQAGLGATLAPLLFITRRASGSAAPPPAIHPRADWGADLPPRGPLDVEQPGDVRFLLVHHSVSVNDYPASVVPEELRTFYRLHTGPERGWADLAYNFLVDRFGGIWEGRAGSIDAPVKGDATGGSQGFAQLCCFIGDHRTVAPSPEAQASMVALLAWLAGRYGIDPRPGATTSFTSRGSNRWPAGTPVTTATIAGHRDMSRTACPGDAAYHLVRNDFPTRVAAAGGVPVSAPPATAAAAPPSPVTTSSTTTSSTAPQPTVAPAPAFNAPPPPRTSATAPEASATPNPRAPADSNQLDWPVPTAAAAVCSGLVAYALRRRASRDDGSAGP